LVEVMLIGGGGCEAVRQTGTGINTDMGFHSKVPLNSLSAKESGDPWIALSTSESEFSHAGGLVRMFLTSVSLTLSELTGSVAFFSYVEMSVRRYGATAHSSE